MGGLRLLIAEEQEIVREAFRILLASEPALELVGAMEAKEGFSEVVLRFSPDVLLLGVRSLRLSMIEEVRTIRYQCPKVGIVLLSGAKGGEYVGEFLKDSPGGKAYLLRDAVNTVNELISVIQAVAEGRTVLDPGMVEKLTQGAATPLSSLGGNGLTQRELEILGYMAKAYKNETIAKILCLERKTVEHHINGIFSKMSIDTKQDYHARVQAVLTYLGATGQLQGQFPTASVTDKGPG